MENRRGSLSIPRSSIRDHPVFTAAVVVAVVLGVDSVAVVLVAVAAVELAAVAVAVVVDAEPVAAVAPTVFAVVVPAAVAGAALSADPASIVAAVVVRIVVDAAAAPLAVLLAVFVAVAAPEPVAAFAAVGALVVRVRGSP